MVQTLGEILKEHLDNEANNQYLVVVDGCDYNVYANRYDGEVEVYNCDNVKIAHCTLNGNVEQAFVYYFDENGDELMDNRYGSGNLFFDHDGKTEYDLAHDLGAWLVATHPG